MFARIAQSMSSRRGRRSRTPITGEGDAPVRLPATTGGRDIVVVLGVTWHTILGGDLRARAQRKAREARATHWTHAGGRAESVGTVRLPPRKLRRGRLSTEAHAGAQLMANVLGSGLHAVAWLLPDSRIWLAVVRDGRVLGGGDLVAATARATVALRAAHERFGSALQLHGAAPALLAGRAPDGTPVAPTLDALAQAAGADSLLQARRASGRTPLAAATLAGAALMVAWQAGPQWRTSPLEPLPTSAIDPPAIPAIEAWRESQARFAMEQAMLTREGLYAVWRGVGELPVRPGGWLLTGARCAQASAANWRCEARYRRHVPQATAASLAAIAPTHWELDWPALDEASAGFDILTLTRPLALDALAFAGPGFFADADRLQHLRPGLGHLEVGASSAVALSPPRQPDGEVIAPPPDLAGLRQRSVRLAGPLRSLALVDAELTSRIAWRELTVDVDPAAHASPTRSILMAHFHGTSYELAR